jgi:hypothetical protein
LALTFTDKANAIRRDYFLNSLLCQSSLQDSKIETKGLSCFGCMDLKLEKVINDSYLFIIIISFRYCLRGNGTFEPMENDCFCHLAPEQAKVKEGILVVS